ncbi:hypothetical protein JW964_27750 [candidate division KSB1 bacterium]|nr:hypothetical protein [candidate division KSB1 bacterium]
MKNVFISLCIIILTINYTFSQKNEVGFDSERWDKTQAKVVEHLKRQAIIGTAAIKDLNLKNGIIEVDIATTEKSRSYPGLLFRMSDQANYERIYIRPHRSPFYNDALQYAPTFNGVDSWQLYNGPGKTASLDIQPNQWNHLKIVVVGNQAHIFWNDNSRPVLIIDQLAHEESSGTVGLSGPMDGSAFYSNFSYTISDSITLPTVIAREPVCGAISQWELSTPFPLVKADFTQYPDKQLLAELTWQSVQANDAGLVDISRYYPRKNRGGDCILAKTLLKVEKDTLLQVGFGYSDFITVFLNQQPVFFGNSAYQSRDQSFLGIVGYFDNLFLPLKKGKNELKVQMGESMGGWAFCFRKEAEIYHLASIEKKWVIKGPVSIPEAIVYDPAQNVCYVSNYFNEGKEFLSKISPGGEVLTREWITGLRMPTGMCLKENTLYAIDRTGLNVIDTRKGEITEKIQLTGMLMPNDVAIDGTGNLYISDTRGNAVFRYAKGKLEKWLEGLDGPNALCYENNNLLIGQNGQILVANIRTKAFKSLVNFEVNSNIDGIEPDGKGNYFVSDYHGKLYQVSKDGNKTLLLNTTTPGISIADFAFLPKQRLFIIPTLTDNSVTCYSLK